MTTEGLKVTSIGWEKRGTWASPRIQVLIVVLFLAAIWAYARFGWPAPGASSPTTGAFAQPLEFIATPAGSAGRINVRAGPGGEFGVRRRLQRGAVLTGISRELDKNGASWIVLANGEGYAKESVLSASPGQAPR